MTQNHTTNGHQPSKMSVMLTGKKFEGRHPELIILFRDRVLDLLQNHGIPVDVIFDKKLQQGLAGAHFEWVGKCETAWGDIKQALAKDFPADLEMRDALEASMVEQIKGVCRMQTKTIEAARSKGITPPPARVPWIG